MPAADDQPDDATIDDLALRLLDADANANTLEPITASVAGFDLDAAYRVQASIARERRAAGWQPLGRKIGFTNRTIWEAYGVDAPMWAHVWDRTVVRASDGTAELSLAGLVQPRIEPEVVFGLRSEIPLTDDAVAVLDAVEWIAAGFEIVRCPYPRWRFALADSAAAFGLHGLLFVGPPVPVDHAATAQLAGLLASFELTLHRGDEVVDRGTGANVLDSPALALGHLGRVLAAQSLHEPVAAGELVTTGTLTDARSLTVGETWRADYGALGLPSITLVVRD